MAEALDVKDAFAGAFSLAGEGDNFPSQAYRRLIEAERTARYIDIVSREVPGPIRSLTRVGYELGNNRALTELRREAYMTIMGLRQAVIRRRAEAEGLKMRILLHAGASLGQDDELKEGQRARLREAWENTNITLAFTNAPLFEGTDVITSVVFSGIRGTDGEYAYRQLDRPYGEHEESIGTQDGIAEVRRLHDEAWSSGMLRPNEVEELLFPYPDRRS